MSNISSAGGMVGMREQGYNLWDHSEKTDGMQKWSEAEKLEKCKENIWNKIHAMPWGSDVSIQITDGALEKMIEDKEFADKMMNLIQEDARGSNKMCGGTLIRIDETGYKGYSYMAHHEKEERVSLASHSRNKDSFFVRRRKKKEDYRRLWEERRYMHDRITNVWNAELTTGNYRSTNSSDNCQKYSGISKF